MTGFVLLAGCFPCRHSPALNKLLTAVYKKNRNHPVKSPREWMVLVLVMILLQVGGKTMDVQRSLPLDVSGIQFPYVFCSVCSIM